MDILKKKNLDFLYKTTDNLQLILIENIYTRIQISNFIFTSK